MLFGELVKKTRLNLEMSQDELGKKANISNIENETRYISYEYAMELATLLKIDPAIATKAYLNSFLKRKNIPYKIKNIIKT